MNILHILICSSLLRRLGIMEAKSSGKERKYNRICLFLTEEETQRLYDVMYKEKLMPAKILRKALMKYIDEVLSEKEEGAMIL